MCFVPFFIDQKRPAFVLWYITPVLLWLDGLSGCDKVKLKKEIVKIENRRGRGEENKN